MHRECFSDAILSISEEPFEPGTGPGFREMFDLGQPGLRPTLARFHACPEARIGVRSVRSCPAPAAAFRFRTADQQAGLIRLPCTRSFSISTASGTSSLFTGNLPMSVKTMSPPKLPNRVARKHLPAGE